MKNPYRIESPALIAFSGGRTSAFMLRKIIESHGGSLPEGVVATFCNTGLEHEETLKFVERCSIEWDVRVVWLEYRCLEAIASRHVFDSPEPKFLNEWVLNENTDECGLIESGVISIFPDSGVQTKMKSKHSFVKVDYATASRRGEPMTQVIEARRMLPNPVVRFCTAETKIRTMQRYAKSLGWDEYHSAIGLRYDEPRRVYKSKPDSKNETKIYPIYEAKHTLADVEDFWKKQSFRLKIPQYLGNCVGCFLKAKSKIELIAREQPGLLQWWVEQEHKIRNWGEMKSQKSFLFRADRPAYEILLKQAKDQPLLWNDDDFDTMPCNCTD